MKKYILSLLCSFLLLNAQVFAQATNDECATAQNLGTLPVPAACPSGVGAATNVAGTLVGATPGDPYIVQNGCSGAGGTTMGAPANDVWYSFVASGYEAIITVNSTFTNPNVAMYAGSCASLGGGVGGCAVGTGGTVTLTVEQMVIGTTYYLQVSGNVGQTGTFNLSVKNNKGCSDCINSTNLSVSPLPVNGMYSPGQVVHFCYHISAYAEINTNWLHGVQVSLGSGWNAASVAPSPVTSSDCGTWTYYPAGITDPSGQPWPAGFYFNRTCAPLGGGTAADGIPGNNYGDHVIANTALDQNIYNIPAGTWNFCFDVTVANGCNPGSNLSITINTSGDGESGPWTSAGCASDPATSFHAVGACCAPTMSSVPATCAANDGTATATPVGAAGPYDYTWTNSSGTVVSTTTGAAGANTATGLSPGTYTVSLSNALNCVITNTVTVGGVPPQPTPTAGSNSPVCAGGTLNLTAATVAGATYTWAGPNSFASGIQNPSVASVTAADAGTYTVTAHIGPCLSSSTVSVIVNPVPTVTVPANSTVCNGSSIPATVFTSTPTGATFAWTNTNATIGIGASGTGNIASFTATNTGTAPVTATITVIPTLSGCPGTPSSYTITVNPTPTVVVPANSTVCNGGSIAATSFTSPVTGATFTWTNSNAAIGIPVSGTGDIAAFTGTNTGTAPITATITVTPTANTCPGTPSTYTITVNPTPTVVVPANITVCDGGTVAATNFTSPTTGTTFAWTNSNTAIGLGASGTGNIAAFTATNASAASISSTITVTPTANGCPGTPSTYTITVNPTPTVTVPPNDTLCNGSSVAATNFTSPVAGATFAWTNSNPAIGISASGTGNIASFSATNTGTAPITATITVTPNAGCAGTPSSYTITVNPTPVVTVPANITVCDGATIAASNFTSGVTGTTFSWTNTNTAIGIAASGTGNIAAYTASNTTSGSVSGTITVTPTANGCPGTPVSYTITINPVPTVVVPANDTVCNGSSIPATNFTSPVTGATFNWTNSNATIGIPVSGTGNIASFNGTNTGAAPITATITVTPAAGCPGTPSSYSITVNPTPTVVVPANIVVCNGATIAASNFTSNVTGATFAWTNTNTAIGIPASGTGNIASYTASNTTSGPVSGTITVTPTANGCPGTPVSYTITINPIATVAVPANAAYCNGSTVPATNFTSPVTGTTFTWTNSNTAIGIPTSGTGDIASFTATNATAATITATITVTPVASCPGTASTYTITVNPTPTVVVPSDTTVCGGISIPATNFTSPVAGATFGWTNSNTSIGLGANGLGNIPSFTAANATASPITSTITVVPVANTCIGTPGTYTITVNPHPVVNAGPDDTICYGQNTLITATPNGAGYSYSWLPAAGLSNPAVYNPTANPSATTTYTITTSLNGCTGKDSITIYSDPQISIAKTAINVTCNGACNGQTIVIPNGGSGIFHYVWTSGDTTAAVSGLCPGSYTVTVTDSWGCIATADTIVTEPTAVVASITAQTPTSCNGVCDGTANSSANGGTPGAGYTFSWNTVPVQPTANATGLCAGPFVITVTDSKGCTDTAHVTIIQPTPVVVPPIASVTICIGGSTTITAMPSGGNGGYQYAWLPAGTGGDTASVDVSPIVTTSYTVNVTDVKGCTAPAVIDTVNVNPPLNVIAAGTTSICPGTATPISASATGGDGNYTYTWTPVGTPAGTPVSVTPNTTTNYTVTVTDGCGTPSATDNVTITVLPLPTPVFSADITSGCAPLCVHFTDASTISSGTITGWNWDFGDGSPDSISQNPSHCFQNPGLYSITLTDTSAAGCYSTFTHTDMIDVFALPHAEFTAAPNPATTLNSEVAFTDQSSSDVTYWEWLFGDGATLSPNTPDPIHTYPNDVAAGYLATLIVHNANGCYDTTAHPIDIGPEFTFFIPNAFTPNGDGINDYFNGAGIGIIKYEMYIFDRWGNLIYDTDSLSKPWDGKANHGAEMAQQDVYVWKVKLTDVFDKKHNYIGTVTIVK